MIILNENVWGSVNSQPSSVASAYMTQANMPYMEHLGMVVSQNPVPVAVHILERSKQDYIVKLLGCSPAYSLDPSDPHTHMGLFNGVPPSRW